MKLLGVSYVFTQNVANENSAPMWFIVEQQSIMGTG